MKYQIQNGAVFLSGKSILDEINFEITDKSHIGIVGKNGSGKTTLLNTLLHNEILEEGLGEEPFKITKIGSFTIGYLEQITFENENITLLEEIRKSFQDIITIERKLDEYIKKMETNTSNELIEEYTNLLDKYNYLGGYTYQKEYEIMLKKFGFTENDKEKKISDFSGGERTKLAFLKLLLSKPDILFLDEPTNHLDIEAILWLENYLKNYKKAFVVVSHDRMFLNNIVNTIYDITYHKVIKYVGNFEDFERQKKENYERDIKNFERQQKEIKRLRALYEKFRYKPSKASMALSKLHMIERMEILEKPRKESEKAFKINLEKIEPSGKTVLTCKDLKVGYDRILTNLSFEILQGQRIGVIGANGTGKSTLLKSIQGLLKPLGGAISFGYHVKIGYFDQNLEMIDEEHTILEEFKCTFPDVLDHDAKSALGAFLFSGEDTNKKVSVLSGGEKVRLQLCKILYDKPNFLILDEPTNHMDLVGKERLESILKEYKGTVLFVSHDRYFVKKIATSLIVFNENNATYYPYTYEEYLEKQKNMVTSKEETLKEKKKTKIVPKQNLQEEKKNLKKLEKEIEKLELKKKELNQELEKPLVYQDYEKAREIQKELESIDVSLHDLEQEWERIMDLIDNETKNS